MNKHIASASLLLILSSPAALAQTSGNWTQQMPKTSPSARDYALLAYDTQLSRVVLFGGIGETVFLNDTWIWDGTNWAATSSAANPPPGSGSSMVYDAARGQVVLFGNDGSTWTFDGFNWTQKSPQNSPSARSNTELVYDSVHGQSVLFGGSTSTQSFNETWLWDGTNWTQAFPQISPPARFLFSMAYDSKHSQVVVFGGRPGNGPVLDDTWVWNGTNWTQMSPQTSPPANSESSMAYDAAHSQMVLFGAGDADNQTWLWDGANWTLATPPSSPPGRFFFSMAYDSAHSQVVLFGGFVITGVAGDVGADTWTWTGASATPPPPSGPTITSVISASGFGGFSTVAPGSWVEIYGSNLAPDTRQWAGTDFSGSNGSNAPTVLDGVQVSIGGQKAFVEYISSSPAQINAQLPSNIPTGGPLPVTVTNGTQTSGAFNVTVNPTMPGLLAPASFLIGGNQYVVALLSDNVTYILPTGAIAGVASRPAKPGETIVLYGVGFGGVTPSIPAGQIVGQSNQIAASFQISFGGIPAQAVSYAGLAPNYVGLYQFDVVVPAVADNDLVPVTFTLGGVSGTQTLYIAVHQ
jgi:uncharacterized protein (TIGR03437 family)